MKKLLSVLLLAVLLVGMAPVKSNASEKKGTEIAFDELSYCTHDYDGMNVKVDYDKVGDTEIATVRDRNGNVLETATLKPLDSYSSAGGKKKLLRRSAGTVSSHILTRNKKFGKTTLSLNVTVEMWSQGSFRQINDVKGYYLGISSKISAMTIENSQVNVWSSSGYPTTKLLYGYSGTLLATIGLSPSASVKKELESSGFSYSGTMNGNIYYRRPFNEAGQISIY